MTINGEAVTLTGASTQQDVIDAINAVSSASGVTAQAATSLSFDITYTPPATNTSIEINGVSIAALSTDTGAGDLIDRINAVSNQTGVSAALNGTDITLSNSDGAQIELIDTNATAVTSLGTGTHYLYGGIDLVADFGQAIVANGTAAGATDLNLGSATTETIDDVSVLTRADATLAIQTVDFALGQINGYRSEFGAIQNRFESTIENLSTASENMSAARSRIRDTDFAAETAALTRSQILQQAGTAMLAQANAAPQTVMALIQ